jgi:hypothetical protein
LSLSGKTEQLLLRPLKRALAQNVAVEAQKVEGYGADQ